MQLNIMLYREGVNKVNDLKNILSIVHCLRDLSGLPFATVITANLS